MVYHIFGFYKSHTRLPERMTEEFQQSIREWVSLDNQIKTLNEQVKELRTKRQHVTSQIMTISDTHGYDNATINISDGTLKLADVSVTSSLTLNYVKACLLECLDNEDKVDEIMEFIKENRPVKNTRDIKRYVKK